MAHRTVLLHETIDLLDIKHGNVIVDATLNGGGHTEEILRRFGKNVTIVGIDLDSDAIARAKKRIGAAENVTLVQANFRAVDSVISSLGLTKIDRMIMDLGWSSDQVEASGRGFTFQHNEPLIMTYSTTPSILTAAEIVNSWPEQALAEMLWNYAEERSSRRIAKAIIEFRKKQKILTTFDLIAAVTGKPAERSFSTKRHPATKVFQALRIAVNDEFGALKEGMTHGFDLLTSGGRLAIITFHSIEDRMVKQWFKECDREKKGRVVTKKACKPSRQEITTNRRARSAILRVLEKV